MTAPHPTVPGVTFKDIPDFPGYCVGDDGSVWTIKAKGGNDRSADRFASTWRPMRTHNFKGYRAVNLTRDGANYHRLVHQLILEAFIGPCPAGMEARHYPDPDPTNNRPGNLRWGTHAENMEDKYRDRPTATEKTCRRCGVVKPVTEFYRDSRASDGLKAECKPCHRATALRTADPEVRRRNNREYMRRRRSGG